MTFGGGTIDFDSAIIIPIDLKIFPEDQIRSRVRGQWSFMPSKIALFLTRKQRRKNILTGRELKNQLEGQTVMGVQLLEYLMGLYKDSKNHIPKIWFGKTIFFWGTIYQSWRGEEELYVQYLYFDTERDGCIRGYRYLGDNFDENSFAIISVPPKYVKLPEEDSKEETESDDQIIDDDGLDFL